MKLSLCSIIALVAQSAVAFAPPALVSLPTSTTTLNLFGGGNKQGGEKKPGMMDQLAMFKKAQEIAQKKKMLDEELQAVPFEAQAADGRVKATFKYVPVANPMDPNPDYDAIGFEFDDEFFASASPEELGVACQEAVLSGIEKINLAVAEKYKSLQEDLMAAMQPKTE